MKERDYEAASRCIERGAAGRLGTTDRNLALGPDRERGAVGIDARTFSAGDGRADGRTRQTLAGIEHRGREQGERFKSQVEAAAPALSQASARAQQAAENLDRFGQWTEWRHYLLTVMTGMMSAMLVTAFWLWLAPPIVQNHLDAKAVAEYLRPEIAAVKPSKGK